MLTHAANSYLEAGLCVLPAKRAEKRPALPSWKRYQERLPTAAELSAWIANPRSHPDAICILCGNISGNLEMIDFDAGGELFSAWWERLPADLRDRLIVETSPSGGYHVIYRCEAAICGNLKLAQRKEGDKIVTLIETRGEGGLFLCAPTPGYELIQGDLRQPPVLTANEREALLQAAWELNEYGPPVVNVPRNPSHSGMVGQTAPSSAAHGNQAADNSHIGDCPSNNANIDGCSPHSAMVGQTAPSSVAQGEHAPNDSNIGACRSHNGNQAADNSNIASCSSHSADLCQRTASSVAHGDLSADNSHIGACPSHNANIGACSSHNANVSESAASSVAQDQMSANNSNIGACSLHSGIVGESTASSAAHGDLSTNNSHPGACSPDSAARPGDDFNIRGDVRAVLEQHGWLPATERHGADGNEYWRRPGKDSGWSATLKERVFYVFSSNAAPFEPNRAYSPFSVYTMLNHGGDFEQAARSLRQLGYGSDTSNLPADSAGGVDISALLAMSVAQGQGASNIPHSGAGHSNNSGNGEHRADIADPGPIPEHLFHVPGFVAEVMAFTLANAPYPNVGLAFCGAIALQSLLTGRKVRTPGDLRPNIYLLALASSGTGKDFPRKVNSRVLFQVGLVSALGDKFASGEGIQDALARTNAMLFQNDEMDGVLRQINLDRENKRESIPNVMLTLYTSANDIYPLRVRAGQKEAGHIDQPHLTLFGTATPQYFYESLSHRMLTNGFFARMIIVDIGKRGPGQSAGSVRNVPDDIIRVARWWAEYQPGTRHANLLEMHPDPRVVTLDRDATTAIERLQRMTEVEYDRAESKRDEVGRTAWSRTCENASKLAMLYACSENHENPIITLPAVEWATAFAMHQTRRQLFLAQSYVAENPFHAECLKVVRKLREAPGQEMSHQVLLKRMKIDAKSFRELIETLMQRGDVRIATVQTTGRTGAVYRLADEVKEGEEG